VLPIRKPTGARFSTARGCARQPTVLRHVRRLIGPRYVEHHEKRAVPVFCRSCSLKVPCCDAHTHLLEFSFTPFPHLPQHKVTCATYQSNICWICNEGSKEESRLYRACSCRQEKGFGHIACFVQFAKSHSEQPYIFERCPNCRVMYRGEINKALTCAKIQMAAESGDELQSIQAESSLGHTFMQHGRFREALPLFEEVIRRYENFYGRVDMFVHLRVAEAGLDLVCTLNNIPRYQDAIELLEEMQTILTDGRGEQWRRSLEGSMLRYFAFAYENLGRNSDALTYARQSVQVHQEYLDNTGDYQPALAYALETQAGIMQKLGRRDEAIKIVKKAHKLMKKALGSTHPETISLKERCSQFAA